jgi:predicted phosphodiesterase
MRLGFLVGLMVVCVLVWDTLAPTHRLEAAAPTFGRSVRAWSGPTAPESKAPAVRTANAPLTFAVVADLHTPKDGHVSPTLQRVIAAVAAARPRFVVVAGDSTNGNPTDGRRRRAMAPRWWAAVRETLRPLREAGIAVLPVAGNHDSYHAAHRAAYAEAFADLDAWAAPLRVLGRRVGPGEVALDAAPFSYAVEVEGVHLTLAHIVDQVVAPEVKRWLESDLAATDAQTRIVVGHVPIVSVMSGARPWLRNDLGPRFAAAGVDLYLAGHEHLVWDEVFEVPGGRLRQVSVGTAHGTYNYGPAQSARRRAGCGGAEAKRCTLPVGGTRFGLRTDRASGRKIQHHRLAYTLVQVDGETLTATPMTLDGEGRPVAFGLPSVEGRTTRVAFNERHDHTR